MTYVILPPIVGLIGPIGWPELLILAVIGVIIFGKRLPEVGKSVGKGIVEFKKGLSGIEDEINQAASSGSSNEQESAKLEDQAGGDSVQADKTERQPAQADSTHKPSG